MKKELIRKGLVIGIICLFLMVYIPSINGKEIDYPEEDGPYTVYISGSILNIGHDESLDLLTHILPFWYLNSSQHLCYRMGMLSIFNVNGSLQKIKYPALICLYGFKGFAPTWWIWDFKWIIFRCRIIGKCDRIFVHDDITFNNYNQIQNMR